MFSPNKDFFAAKMDLVLQAWQQMAAGTVGTASIARLSHRAGVSTAYIFHLRRGRICNPSFIHLARIAEAVGFDVSWWKLDVSAGPPQVSTTAL